MTAPMTTADILRKTARLLATGEVTWGQGDYVVGRTGCRCALGAITFAADPTDLDGDPKFVPLAHEAAGVLADYLVSELDAPEYGDRIDEDVLMRDATETVGGWNDQPSRTLAEVVAALEAAADRAQPPGVDWLTAEMHRLEAAGVPNLDNVTDPDVIGHCGLEYDGPRCADDDCRTPVDNDGEVCGDCSPCPTCQGVGGWQQPDGLIVECPRGCMAGGAA